jgi:hypothetical protein
MIKIVGLDPLPHARLALRFSDGTHGMWSAADVIARDTVLTRPLTDPEYFGRAFIEGGALAWPNGLEFSPAALHAQLAAAGSLERYAA